MSELTTEMIRTSFVTSAASAERFDRWLAGVKDIAWIQGNNAGLRGATNSPYHHQARLNAERSNDGA